MIQIRQTEWPKEFADCDGCGSYDDVKIIRIYQTAFIKGKETQISGNIPELRLCRKCRVEMARICMNEKV